MQEAAGTYELGLLYQHWFQELSDPLQSRGPVLDCLKGGQSLREMARRPYALHDDNELVLDVNELC